MATDTFAVALPTDSRGKPLRVPRGLHHALDAFRHAQQLAQMAQLWGPDEPMIDAGFEIVTRKLHAAARATENDKMMGPMYHITSRTPPSRGSYSPKGMDPDYKAFAVETDDGPLREWVALADFWAWAAREDAPVPELDDVRGWVALMRRPRVRWSNLWAAYCVAQVEAM
ncbi:hypothetical protein Q5752_000732 [Cryptotrichosporon argae]